MYKVMVKKVTFTAFRGGYVEFVLAPQHETPYDSEIIKKEDFDYWRKIIEESYLEVYRRIHDRPNEVEN